jgi:Tol biopolymer transport system component
MRIIRNLLILCVLMCGLLFGAQQFSAGIGKGDVVAYGTCRNNTCTPKILDTRTRMVMGFNIHDLYEVFWTEDGNLYSLTQDTVNRVYNIYLWETLVRGDIAASTYVSLTYNKNNQFSYSISSGHGRPRIVNWNGLQWSEYSFSLNTTEFKRFDDGRFAVVSEDRAIYGGVNSEIYIFDGVAFDNISQNNLYDGTIAWSEDNKQLAFISERDGNSEVYVWNGTTLTNISQHPAYDGAPFWSSDGRLAFTSERDGNREIYVWDGTTLTNISQHPAHDDIPLWSTDGQLAFTSERDGNKEIYVWDGQALTNISQTPENDTKPAWSDDGRLAFVTANKTAYVCGKTGLRPIEFGEKGPSGFYYFRWLSHGRLLFDDIGAIYIWDDEGTVEILASEIIEHGDGQIAFFSNRYAADGHYELYALYGHTIVGTGFVNDYTVHPDGKGGLLGIICEDNRQCDIYHWKDGQTYQITYTPDISEGRPALRP